MRLPSGRRIERMRRGYARQSYARWPGFLDARLLKRILPRIRAAAFRERYYAKSYRGICRHWSRALSLLLDQPPLHDCVQRLSGCPYPIRAIRAVVYRQTSDKRHRVLWHTDPPTLNGRWAECTLSVNLGGSYEGGELEIRAPGGKRLMARIANKKSGDAVLFRHTLVHRGAPVVGPRPKLVLFVWFSLRPLHRAGKLSLRARKGVRA